MCMIILPAYMSSPHVQCPQRPEGGVRFPDTEAVGGCGPPCEW